MVDVFEEFTPPVLSDMFEVEGSSSDLISAIGVDNDVVVCESHYRAKTIDGSIPTWVSNPHSLTGFENGYVQPLLALSLEIPFNLINSFNDGVGLDLETSQLLLKINQISVVVHMFRKLQEL
jgi:hypothetical protein